MIQSNFELENELKSLGYGFIIGIDEAGRGPLAGPVVASAVILKSEIQNSKFEKNIKHKIQNTKYKILDTY